MMLKQASLWICCGLLVLAPTASVAAPDSGMRLNTDPTAEPTVPIAQVEAQADLLAANLRAGLQAFLDASGRNPGTLRELQTAQLLFYVPTGSSTPEGFHTSIASGEAHGEPALELTEVGAILRLPYTPGNPRTRYEDRLVLFPDFNAQPSGRLPQPWELDRPSEVPGRWIYTDQTVAGPAAFTGEPLGLFRASNALDDRRLVAFIETTATLVQIRKRLDPQQQLSYQQLLTLCGLRPVNHIANSLSWKSLAGRAGVEVRIGEDPATVRLRVHGADPGWEVEPQPAPDLREVDPESLRPVAAEPRTAVWFIAVFQYGGMPDPFS